MPTAKKAQEIADLTDALSRSQLTVFCDYRGLSVSELQTLRKNLRPHGGEFRVAKNTLTNIAAKANGVDGLDDILQGPTGVVFIDGDMVSSAKAINDFVRTSRVLQVKGGVLAGQVISAADVEAVATLPSKDELRSKLLGLFNSPMSRTVGVLSGPSRSMAYVLNARAGQQGESAAAD
jgi:large subunit ribosomal protein L10